MNSIPWNRLNTGLLLLVLLAIIGLFAARTYGGPLDPPGPVAPTQATLIYQPATCGGFPIVISNPGSYRLAGNITGCGAGQDGIQITTGIVALDLAGFSVIGVANSGSGIKSVGATTRLSISNGSITAWNSSGLDLETSSFDRVENIHSSYNGYLGIQMGGSSNLSHSSASNNAFWGIKVPAGSASVTISDCHVDSNHAQGIYIAGVGAVVDRCEVGGNGTGIDAGGTARIVNNQVHHNNGGGIFAGDSCYIENNSVSWNGDDGVTAYAPGNCTIVGNKATQNTGSGFVIEAGGGLDWVDSNHASGNGQWGFDIGAANLGYPHVVTRNVATHNVAGSYAGGSNSDVAPAVTAASATKPFNNITD